MLQVDLRINEASQSVERQNVEVLCQLSKEMELAVLGMQIMQSQMAKLLQEKENVKEFHLESQKRNKDLSSEVLRLNLQIIEKERSYEAKLKELNTKIQEQDASFISWNEEKEVIIERPSCSLHKSILFLKSCGLMNNNIFPFS